MKHLRKPRFWLLTTAALIFGSHMSASAQSSTVFQPGNYQVGAPTTVAAAPSLPNISADQIARDVIADFNPRTGQTELIAAPFDPFEADPNLAGSLRLRSADGAVAINGQPLQNGALVDVDFYYNSPSDDPYGGRNYSDAVFVSGDLAPVVLRDTRVLECSTRVENVEYIHTSYYSPVYSPVSRFGLYQPYRHYTGHSSFGFGFGSNYFGPGINFFNNNRSRFARNNFTTNTRRNFLPRTNLPNAGFRNSPVRRRGFISPLRSRIATGNTRANTVDTNAGTEISPAAQTSAPSDTVLRRREALSRIGAGGRRLTERNLRSPRRVATPAIANAESTSVTPAASRVRQRTADTTSRRRALRRGQSQTATSRQVNPKRNVPTPVVPKQSVSRPVISKQSAPKRSASKQSKSSSSQTKSRSSSKRSTTSSRSSLKSRTSTGTSKAARRSTPSIARRGKLNFFPNDGYGASSVVTSRSVDCAREDKLSVFIPNDRLDAARFDGLTLIALDAQGGETPIYIPPNYIQGFRLAATGRVQPQGLSAPQPQVQPQPQPQFQPQRPGIEAAPCPAGTQKQPDGTCLQASITGFPTR